ncbi:MAG: prepilin-type N-terminal cleavage/methylation domain-containing protein [Candidatus Buchananbacteria bacterium]|nr:prepilin-type N-terminal cleavage/methylation domain-containing protein [Candidatus Buchananbacteria bacterium]
MQVSNRGFTLIELIVVLSIMMVMTSIVTIQFRRQDRHQELRYQAQLVQDLLRQAQTRVLAGVRVDGVLPAFYGAAVGCLPEGCQTFLIAQLPTETDIRILETLTLPPEMRFDNLNTPTLDGDGGIIAFYELPQARLQLIERGVPVTTAVIKFEHTATGVDPECLTINTISGRIDLSTCTP